jgi:hypothetical protein
MVIPATIVEMLASAVSALVKGAVMLWNSISSIYP